MTYRMPSEPVPTVQHAATPRAQGRPYNATWIVRTEWAHPHWNTYAVLLYDVLTEVPERGPAHLYRSDATHEVTVFALDPDHPVPVLDGAGNAEPLPRFMQPPEHGYQFTAESDEAARARIAFIVGRIADRKLSPTEDFVQAWNALFADGVTLKRNRMQVGSQPVGHA